MPRARARRSQAEKLSNRNVHPARARRERDAASLDKRAAKAWAQLEHVRGRKARLLHVERALAPIRRDPTVAVAFVGTHVEAPQRAAIAGTGLVRADAHLCSAGEENDTARACGRTTRMGRSVDIFYDSFLTDCEHAGQTRSAQGELNAMRSRFPEAMPWRAGNPPSGEPHRLRPIF